MVLYYYSTDIAARVTSAGKDYFTDLSPTLPLWGS